MYFNCYWAVETLGDLQPTSRGLDPVVKCKIHMIPMLMHQIHPKDKYYNSWKFPSVLIVVIYMAYSS
jgi:hypothetical protein